MMTQTIDPAEKAALQSIERTVKGTPVDRTAKALEEAIRTIARLDDDAGYRAAHEKLGRIRGEIAELNVRRNELLATIRPARVQQEDPVTLLARQYLETGAMSEVTAANDAVFKKLEAIDVETTVKRRAEQLQEEAVERERARVSAIVLRKIAPLYEALVRAQADVLSAVLFGNSAISRAIADLADAGVTWSGHIRPMQVAIMGRHDQQHENGRLWLKDFAEHFGG